MQKRKAYKRICFFPDTIKEAGLLFNKKIKDDVIDLAEKLSSAPQKSDDEIISDKMGLHMVVQIGDEDMN
jgi:hypothetical protein